MSESPPAVMKAEQILGLLPHRYPFLLIDRVLELTDERVLCLKNVTFNEPYFQGHFPGVPVMPGVLQIEAMAQAGGILALRHVMRESTDPAAGPKPMYFMAIDKAKFRKPVLPGDQLHYHVRKIRNRGRVWRFYGEAKVDGHTVAEAEISAMLADTAEARAFAASKNG